MGKIFGPLSVAVREPLSQPTIENLPTPLAKQKGAAGESIAEAPGRIAQVTPPAAISPVHEPIPGRPLRSAQLPRFFLVAGRSVLVQGAGSVGAVLARELVEADARVLVSDVDESRAAATGCETVPPEAVLVTEVDVYSPCAIGGVLDAESIPRLACRAIAGCANNQLADPEATELLQERGILYAPDYIVSAGGIIQLIGLEDEGWDETQLEERLAGIGDTLRTLYAEADGAGITPEEAADRLVRRRLDEARAG